MPYITLRQGKCIPNITTRCLRRLPNGSLRVVLNGKMSNTRNDKLQALCREYLGKLRYMANKHGLGKWIDDTMRDNAQGKCKGTEHECRILARMVDDERIKNTDIPKMLGKSYRKCYEEGAFHRIKKLPSQGSYSKISALLYKQRQKGDK